MRNRAGAILLVLIGLGMVAGGVWYRSAAVTCDGRALVPGEQCVDYSDDSRTAYTYDQSAEQRHGRGQMLAGVGVLVLGYGGYQLLRDTRSPRTDIVAA